MNDHAYQESDAPLDVDELQDKYKRALAELDNLRKRKAKEVEQARDQGEARVATAFLDTADSFRRAINAIATTKGKNARQQVIDGFTQVFAQFEHTLKVLEIQGFHSEGQKFTAELMEAIAQVPSKTLPPGTVAAEVSQGFTRRGKLLRAAQVAVAIAEEDGHDDK